MNHISIVLPATDGPFEKKLSTFLSRFATVGADGTGADFSLSSAEYLPHISVKFSSVVLPEVQFTGEGETIAVELNNKTGIDKKSPHVYTHISLDDFLYRISRIELGVLDHVGFDIPWFDGVHPEIVQLREQLKNECLYYLFPTGEAWDFIIPGTSKEIATEGDPDLSVIRRPKFEIVSIDKVSSPLIQFECTANMKYAEMVQLFPEGIAVPEVPCVWVYIANAYGIDICIVLNEHSGHDWSGFFAGQRLK